MSRTILIDDTDPGITYNGQWFSIYDSQNDLGNFGTPYQGTLQGTSSDANFAYTFQGTTIEITGTQQYQNTSAVTNPSWECIVDGKSIEVQTYSYANNRLVLCSLSNITDGTHTIVVNVHVTDNRTFWFDFLTYQPSASVSLEQAAISVRIPEPDMNFGTGWEPFANGYKTSLTGSIYTFDFNGISLTWYGSYDSQFPLAATTATYTVDGGELFDFNINGVAALKTAVQYNQLFFTTPTYSPGIHTLQVTYQGNSDTTPLTLEFITIQNGTLSSSTGSSIPSESSGNTASATSASGTLLPTHSATRSTGPIVGGVVGCLALIIGAILLFLFLRRRGKRFQLPEAEEDDMRTAGQGFIAPYTPDIRPHHLSTSKTSTTPPNLIVRDHVAGKRNIAANAARAAGQSFASPIASATPVIHGNSSSSSSVDINDSPLDPINAANSVSRSQPGMVNFPASGNNLPEGVRIIRDEDSGIRVRQTDEGDVMVLPPLYTIS